MGGVYARPRSSIPGAKRLCGILMSPGSWGAGTFPPGPVASEPSHARAVSDMDQWIKCLCVGEQETRQWGAGGEHDTGALCLAAREDTTCSVQAQHGDAGPKAPSAWRRELRDRLSGGIRPASRPLPWRLSTHLAASMASGAAYQGAEAGGLRWFPVSTIGWGSRSGWVSRGSHWELFLRIRTEQAARCTGRELYTPSQPWPERSSEKVACQRRLVLRFLPAACPRPRWRGALLALGDARRLEQGTVKRAAGHRKGAPEAEAVTTSPAIGRGLSKLTMRPIVRPQRSQLT